VTARAGRRVWYARPVKNFAPAAALVVVAIAVPPLPARSESDLARRVDPRVRGWLGKKTVDAIAGAERGEIVRVDPKPIDRSGAGKAPPPNVGGYPIIGKARPLDHQLLEAFQKLLLDRRTHDIPPPGVGMGKLCGPIQPGVALRFWSKGDAGRRAPLEILLCFYCGDLLVVGPKSSPQSMSPGSNALLRLAAAGLPDFSELDEMLAKTTQDEARERLFDSMFPADIQLTMQGSVANSDRDYDVLATQLRARFTGLELVRLSARAFGLWDAHWYAGDRRTEIVARAVKQLPAADLLAGLQAIRGDQVALAGAGALFRLGVGEQLKPEQRAEWLPTLAEAALVQEGNVPRCGLMLSLAVSGARAIPLLLKVRRGEIIFPRATGPAWSFNEEPSAAACALLALVRVDRAKAAGEARDWRPSDPLDAAVARVARAQLGDGDVADPALFKTKSTVLPLATLDAYRAHPSAAAVDVIIHEAVGHDYGAVRERAAKVFEALTGLALLASPEDQRVKLGQTWWKDHRESWRPPTTPPR
jgi:hypothetical protein